MLKKSARDLPIWKPTLELLYCLSHWVVDQAFVYPMRPYNLEILMHSPHESEAIMRWVRLKTCADVHFVIRPICVFVGYTDFQSDVSIRR